MNRLKELRQEKGLTQQALADEMGVTKRTYIYWEKGDRQIKPEKAQQLADYFGVSVGCLLGFETYPPELIESMEELEELYAPPLQSGSEEYIEYIYDTHLLFITDIEKIQDLKTDTLVTLQLTEKIRNKLTNGSLRPNTCAWGIEKIVIQLTELLETIEKREKELTIPDN